jgi:hypothetical protein
LLFPVADDDDEDMDDPDDQPLLPKSVPEPIRTMADSTTAIVALGTMVWSVKALSVQPGTHQGLGTSDS